MTGTSRRAALGVCALVLALASCSAGSSPPAGLPIAPSPATSTSAPSPTAVALPSPQRSGVEGEIERAVLAYFANLNEAFVTGDTTAYAQTFTDGCKPCLMLRKNLDAETAKGNRADGLRDEVSNLKVTVGTGQTGFVNADVRVPAYRILDRNGGVVGNYTESSSKFTVWVLKTPTGWKVIDIADAGA